MRKLILFMALAVLDHSARSQDTFSILAFDSITREVGAAGASCLDLFNFPQFSNDFICELFPDTGAVATQASYVVQNQAAARARMRAGDSPTQIMAWLAANDITGNPGIRQYGAVKLDSSHPRTDAHTGVNCTNYKNHIIGPNYTIHGNILQGQNVLDSMEARFLREEGDLACKLMAAMQGAKMIGADTRCYSNQTSSLFAFLKVAQPTDTFGKPSFLVSLKTQSGAQIEPIDSLQYLFNLKKNCSLLTVGNNKKQEAERFKIFPVPAKDLFYLETGKQIEWELKVFNSTGGLILKDQFTGRAVVDVSGWRSGLYFIECRTGAQVYRSKTLIR